VRECFQAEGQLTARAGDNNLEQNHKKKIYSGTCGGPGKEGRGPEGLVWKPDLAKKRSWVTVIIAVGGKGEFQTKGKR